MRRGPRTDCESRPGRTQRDTLCAFAVRRSTGMEGHSRKNWRDHAANVALLVFVLVALYWRVFFFGETVIDAHTLNKQLPWGYGAPEDLKHPYNRRAPTDMYLTREYFIVASYKDGELPLWNPYTFA